MTWDVEGSLDTIELEEHDGRHREPHLPGRAAPGLGRAALPRRRRRARLGAARVRVHGLGRKRSRRRRSHGSLRRGDSLAALAFLNCGPDRGRAPTDRRGRAVVASPTSAQVRAGSLRRRLLSACAVRSAAGRERTARSAIFSPVQRDAPLAAPRPCKRPCAACRPRPAQAGQLGPAGQVLGRRRERLRRQPRRLHDAGARARRALHPRGGARVLRRGDEQLPLEPALDVSTPRTGTWGSRPRAS